MRLCIVFAFVTSLLPYQQIFSIEQQSNLNQRYQETCRDITETNYSYHLCLRYSTEGQMTLQDVRNCHRTENDYSTVKCLFRFKLVRRECDCKPQSQTCLCLKSHPTEGCQNQTTLFCSDDF